MAIASPRNPASPDGSPRRPPPLPDPQTLSIFLLFPLVATLPRNPLLPIPFPPPLFSLPLLLRRARVPAALRQRLLPPPPPYFFLLTQTPTSMFLFRLDLDLQNPLQ
ncbi:unnamed protein product [Brassica oleracea var. botrytis]